MAANQDYLKYLIQQVVQTASTSSDDVQFKKQVVQDLSSLVKQWNSVVYPMLSSSSALQAGAVIASPTSGDPPGDGRIDAIVNGIFAGTLITDTAATQYGPECFWASNRSEPATILETFVCILATIASLENKIAQLQPGTSASTYDDGCVKAELEHIANLISCDYSFNCSTSPTVPHGIYQSLQALSQVVTGWPDFGLDHSCYDAFPNLSIQVLLSNVTLDMLFPILGIQSTTGAIGTTIVDDLNCIYTFIGSTGLGDCAPTYGSGLNIVAVGDSLEDAIYKLDQNQPAAQADSDWYGIPTNSSGVETYASHDTSPEAGLGVFHAKGPVGVGVEIQNEHVSGQMGSISRNFSMLVRSSYNDYVNTTGATGQNEVYSGLLLWSDIESYNYTGSPITNMGFWQEPGSSTGAFILSEIVFAGQDSHNYQTANQQWALTKNPTVRAIYRGEAPTAWNDTAKSGGDFSFIVGGQFDSIRSSTNWETFEALRVSHNVGIMVDPGDAKNVPKHRLHVHTSNYTHYSNSVVEAQRTTIGITHVNAHTTAANTQADSGKGLVLGVNSSGAGRITLNDGTDYSGGALTNQLHFGVIDNTKSHLSIHKATETPLSGTITVGRVGIHHGAGITGGPVRTLHVEGLTDIPPVRINDLQTGSGDYVVVDASGDLYKTSTGGGGAGVLNDLTDVTTDTAIDNEVLAYDTTTGAYKNQTAAEAGLATSTHGHLVSNITDLTASAGELNTLDGIVASTAQLNYLGSVTSNVQTQINTKQALITGAISDLVFADLTASKAVAVSSTGKVIASSVTAAELGHLVGVTSGVQAQLDLKAPIASPTFTGTLAAPTIDADLLRMPGATSGSVGLKAPAVVSGGAVTLVLPDTAGINGKMMGMSSGGTMAYFGGAEAITLTAASGDIILPTSKHLFTLLLDRDYDTGTINKFVLTNAPFQAFRFDVKVMGSYSITFTTEDASDLIDGGTSDVTLPTGTRIYKIVALASGSNWNYVIL